MKVFTQFPPQFYPAGDAQRPLPRTFLPFSAVLTLIPPHSSLLLCRNDYCSPNSTVSMTVCMTCVTQFNPLSTLLTGFMTDSAAILPIFNPFLPLGLSQFSILKRALAMWTYGRDGASSTFIVLFWRETVRGRRGRGRRGRGRRGRRRRGRQRGRRVRRGGRGRRGRREQSVGSKPWKHRTPRR